MSNQDKSDQSLFYTHIVEYISWAKLPRFVIICDFFVIICAFVIILRNYPRGPPVAVAIFLLVNNWVKKTSR